MGVLLKQMQHVQPASRHAQRQSQQAWIMSQQALSPLVQVMQQPSSVIVHSHAHINRLHWHTHMPFLVQHTLHKPSHSILQRFCKVAQAISSVQQHDIFMPPLHFSSLTVQRGAIATLVMPGRTPGNTPVMGTGEPDTAPIIMAERSAVCTTIGVTPFGRRDKEGQPLRGLRSVMRLSRRPFGPSEREHPT